MKYLVLFIITMTLFSCDHRAYHDFYIQNECDQNIKIDIVYKNNSQSSFTITPPSKVLIYQGVTINEVFEDEITFFIKTIEIYKGSKKINIDPMDYKLWQYESNSKYSATSILYVKTGNF